MKHYTRVSLAAALALAAGAALAQGTSAPQDSSGLQAKLATNSTRLQLIADQADRVQAIDVLCRIDRKNAEPKPLEHVDQH